MTFAVRRRAISAGLVALGAVALAMSTPAARQRPPFEAGRLVLDEAALPKALT